MEGITAFTMGKLSTKAVDFMVNFTRERFRANSSFRSRPSVNLGVIFTKKGGRLEKETFTHT